MFRSREILRLESSSGPSTSPLSTTEHKEVSKSFTNVLINCSLILSRTCLTSLLSDTEQLLDVLWKRFVFEPALNRVGRQVGKVHAVVAHVREQPVALRRALDLTVCQLLGARRHLLLGERARF